MNYRGLELKLRKLVEKRLREGFSVVPGLVGFATGDGECCAVGVALPRERWMGAGAYSTVLGVDTNIALAISDGFEGYEFERSAKFKRARAIGRRIRRDYYESK